MSGGSWEEDCWGEMDTTPLIQSRKSVSEKNTESNVDRRMLDQWRDERLTQPHLNVQGLQRLYLCILKTSESFLTTVKSILKGFDCMVFLHILIAITSVYLTKRYNITYDFQLSTLISPIVFPLAFAINTNFRRRDTVLEKIAHFQSSVAVLYMCCREWKKDSNLSDEWIKSVKDRLQNLMLLLKEYLFTVHTGRRTWIMRWVYEDFSDISMKLDEIRRSELKTNGPLISRAIHLLTLLCTSFDEITVIREYPSPRGIRAFNKTLVIFLPVILAPYFVAQGRTNQSWAPYTLAAIVAFVFSTLQGVQDRLDDPFDGFGEDDLKLNAIDMWVEHEFEAICAARHQKDKSTFRDRAKSLGQMWKRKSKLSDADRYSLFSTDTSVMQLPTRVSSCSEMNYNSLEQDEASSDNVFTEKLPVEKPRGNMTTVYENEEN